MSVNIGGVVTDLIIKLILLLQLMLEIQV